MRPVHLIALACGLLSFGAAACGSVTHGSDEAPPSTLASSAHVAPAETEQSTNTTDVGALALRACNDFPDLEVALKKGYGRSWPVLGMEPSDGDKSQAGCLIRLTDPNVTAPARSQCGRLGDVHITIYDAKHQSPLNIYGDLVSVKSARDYLLVARKFQEALNRQDGISTGEGIHILGPDRLMNESTLTVVLNEHYALQIRAPAGSGSVASICTEDERFAMAFADLLIPKLSV